MPSFDVVSRVEMHELENALNNTRKAIATRYDFRNSPTELTHNAKDKKLHMVAADKMKMEALKEMFQSAAAARKIDLRTFDFKEIEPGASANVKRDVLVREGLEQETAKKAVRMIKDSKIKVQASIQGDELRVTGKQIDDLQAVMTLLRGADLGVPLQFVNMKK